MKYGKIIMLIIVLFTLFGCASEPSQGETSAKTNGELRFAYSQQPASLDTHVNTNTATSDIMRHVYETLLTVDSDYNIQPMLADSWEQSEDGKTITFQLREGVLFHNGEEMLADDVVASMNRWKESAGSRSQFTDATFKAEDDYTVVLELPEQLSTALPALAHSGTGLAAIMPKEIIENASEDGVTEYIGTGPFQFEEWKQDQEIHLTKFADYNPRTEASDGSSGKKEALVDDIHFMFITDASTRIAGIQSGEYDIAESIPYDNVEQLDNDPDVDTMTYTASSLVIHFNKRQGLFTDVKAREAVAAALDIESILKAAFVDEEYYTLNHNFMFVDQLKQWPSDSGKEIYNQNDPEKAEQLLSEMGYDGEEIRIITSRDGDTSYNASVVLLDQLEKIGLNATLEVYDWPSLMSEREDETAYEIYVIGNTLVPEPTTTVFLRKDYAGWAEDPKLETLLKEFRGQASLEDAQDLFDDLQKWYWDYIPAIKVGENQAISATRSTVDNVQYQSGFILWNVSNSK
ncbi:ABC transporter substrate-binding protein [Ornithinibacillus sp. 4-3]|uniref:ABC transporter substrate-binding protein n=1 Tax=Ornithinibacillus sp. 4-3 TaxID=3231488 RepID=A0AB39HVI0_9BACI